MKNIETEHYILKKIEKKYLENIFEILSDPDVITNLNMNIHKTIDDTEKLLNEYEKGYESGEKYPLEIVKKESEEFVGVFLVKRDLYNEDSFEFTIYLDKKFWSQGVYTEVLPYITKFVFEEVKVKHFRGFVKEKNIASRKVLEKCGFTLESIFNVEGIEGRIYSYLKINETV